MKGSNNWARSCFHMLGYGGSYQTDSPWKPVVNFLKEVLTGGAVIKQFSGCQPVTGKIEVLIDLKITFYLRFTVFFLFFFSFTPLLTPFTLQHSAYGTIVQESSQRNHGLARVSRAFSSFALAPGCSEEQVTLETRMKVPLEVSRCCN